jgi:hypothetical protein
MATLGSGRARAQSGLAISETAIPERDERTIAHVLLRSGLPLAPTTTLSARTLDDIEACQLPGPKRAAPERVAGTRSPYVALSSSREVNDGLGCTLGAGCTSGGVSLVAPSGAPLVPVDSGPVLKLALVVRQTTRPGCTDSRLAFGPLSEFGPKPLLRV